MGLALYSYTAKKIHFSAVRVDSNRNLPRRTMFRGIRSGDLAMTVLCKDVGLVIVDQYFFKADYDTEYLDESGSM